MKTTTLDRINRTPMFRLRFRDFMAFKSGRDQYSSIRLPALRKAVTEDVVAAVTAAMHDESLQACCYRCVLRGLQIDKAIRKVKTDAEVMAGTCRRHTGFAQTDAIQMCWKAVRIDLGQSKRKPMYVTHETNPNS